MLGFIVGKRSCRLCRHRAKALHGRVSAYFLLSEASRRGSIDFELIRAADTGASRHNQSFHAPRQILGTVSAGIIVKLFHGARNKGTFYSSAECPRVRATGFGPATSNRSRLTQRQPSAGRSLQRNGLTACDLRRIRFFSRRSPVQWNFRPILSSKHGGRAARFVDRHPSPF